MTLPSRVQVLTRSGCQLCDAAESVAARICEEAGVTWSTIDVDTDEELKARYSDHVPVVFVDGELLSYWFLDADALRGALTTVPQSDSRADLARTEKQAP